MTLEQLDHLRAIDAHLDALLALAAKRTPGEWHSECDEDSQAGTQLVTTMHNRGDGSWYQMVWKDAGSCAELEAHNDAAYIAACAGRAEAGWRSAKAAIACLFACYPDGNIAARSFNAQQMAESILAAWPRELLTLP